MRTLDGTRFVEDGDAVGHESALAHFAQTAAKAVDRLVHGFGPDDPSFRSEHFNHAERHNDPNPYGGVVMTGHTLEGLGFTPSPDA